MKKRHPNGHIIEDKLNQLPAMDVDHLWNDMHAILDKKMPPKKRRRFIAGYIRDKDVLLLIALMIGVSALIVLSPKKDPGLTTKKISGSLSTNKTKNDAVKIYKTSEENLTLANESIQRIPSNIHTRAPFGSIVDGASNKDITNMQSIDQAQKFSENDLFSEAVENFYTPGMDFNLATVDLRAIHRNFLVPTTSYLGKPVITAKMKRNNQNGFYAGIISGVDMSSIHFQSVKTGATKGLIVGYTFNQKWSLESGVLIDKKRVYDNGGHFNPPGYTPTSGITITDVNGKSRLYEWPLNIKYMIVSGKHELFASTGLSSYFMKSENYDYEYRQNNQPGGHNYLSYTNETKNWFSVVNFSIGYSHKLGENGSVRIEPYLKLPIRNIGLGDMPIMSTGLNIGVTKMLRR